MNCIGKTKMLHILYILFKQLVYCKANRFHIRCILFSFFFVRIFFSLRNKEQHQKFISLDFFLSSSSKTTLILYCFFFSIPFFFGCLILYWKSQVARKSMSISGKFVYRAIAIVIPIHQNQIGKCTHEQHSKLKSKSFITYTES